MHLFFYRVNYKEMSVTYGEVKLAVPEGLQELLEDLSRATLRVQPKEIPKFAAEYFQQMLEKRKSSVFFKICSELLIGKPESLNFDSHY